MMTPPVDRRVWLGSFGMGLGGLAVAEMLGRSTAAADGGVLGGSHFPPRAKRVISLFQSGGQDVTSLADEPEHVLAKYGPDAKDPGTFAANCVLARRLAERGVRFIQLAATGSPTCTVTS